VSQEERWLNGYFRRSTRHLVRYEKIKMGNSGRTKVYQVVTAPDTVYETSGRARSTESMPQSADYDEEQGRHTLKPALVRRAA